VCGLQKLLEIGFARGKYTNAIAIIRKRPRHIERGPGSDSITQVLGENASEIGIVTGKITIRPASTIFECLRKIPVINRAKRSNATFQHGISEAAVKVDTLWIDRTCARGLDSRPRSREAVTFLVQALEDGDVFFVMVVVIAGNVAGSAAFDFTDGMRKAIPVGFTLSIGVPRPFNLVGNRALSI
jgi:hypothetical protein